MSDYLKELCLLHKIILVYTDNDYTILSAGARNRTPVIKAFVGFADCPEGIADAILRYYTKNDQKALRQIQNFAEEYLFFLGYDIEPPDDLFLNLTGDISRIEITNKDEKKKKTRDYVEMDILSISEKDMASKCKNVRSEKLIHVSEDDVAELNIIIKDR